MWSRGFPALLRNSLPSRCLYTSGTPVKLVSARYGDPEKDRQRPPLVICHGLFGQKQNWHSVSKVVQRRLGCTIYSLDLRNHGESPWSDSMTYDDMSTDLVAFLESIQSESGFTHFRLLGHSMGGRVVMRMAINPTWQHLIDRLIIEDVSPKTYSKDFAAHVNFRKYIQAMVKMDLSKSRRELLKELETIVPDLPTRQFLLTNLSPTNEAGRSQWRCNLKAIDSNLDSILGFSLTFGAFNGPTLFCYGQNSQYVTERDRNDIKSFFPNVLFKGIPNAGHWVHAEQPAVFIDTICRFLE